MRTNLPALAATAAAALLVNLLLPAATPASTPAASTPTMAIEPGTITATSFRSSTLGEDIAYNVYLPAGYQASAQRYPVLYLLHGRGDSKSAWTQLKGRLDELIANGEIPPTVAVMPDAPWSNRASYFVDSAYKGEDPGRPVETAFIHDLIPHVDATYRTVAERTGRAIAGYSMGGSGALRYAMVYPELFAASIVLSPAVYSPLPPADSSAREFGAYGKGDDAFSASVYKRLNYPEASRSFAAKNLQSHLFIAVGDDEYKNPKPEDFQHDLDFEAHVVFNQAVRVPNLTSEFRVVDGGHDWDVWGPTFTEGAKHIFQFVGKPPVTPMKAALSGTAGEDRAGGVAVDGAGNVYQALAAEGSVDGQPYTGGKDVVLTKYAPDGSKLWTRQLGTSGTDRAYGVALDAQSRPIVTGYTTGNLDGNHPGNTSDDIFAVQYGGAGNRGWITQIGTPTAAESGAFFVAGFTDGPLQTALGKFDGVLAKYSPDRTRAWTRQFGTTEDDGADAFAEANLFVTTHSGTAYLSGLTAGDTATHPRLGNGDVFLTSFDPQGSER